MAKIYLDYNATTPLAPQVIEAVTHSLSHHWGNPSSSYHTGQTAKEAIEISRQYVAEMIEGAVDDIIFTSGGTESNHIVFHSIVSKEERPPHIITSSIEHDSILKPLIYLQSKGSISLTVCKPVNGKVTVDSILKEINSNTTLVSVMLANNETGVIQPVREIGEALGKYNKDNNTQILFHTDAAQAIGKVPVSVKELSVDYMTIVGHKFYGPRIGALYVRDLHSSVYSHMFKGGGQERGYRPGTENTPMIVGLGTAASLVTSNIIQYNSHMSSMREYLERQLKEQYNDKVHFNSHYESATVLPNTVNVSLLQSELLQGYEIVNHLRNSQVSLGAACHTGNMKPSHVLLECGIPHSIAVNAIRISIGRDTTVQDIDNFMEDLKDAVEQIITKY